MCKRLNYSGLARSIRLTEVDLAADRMALSLFKEEYPKGEGVI